MIKPFTIADVNRIADLQPDGWEDITGFFRFYVEAPFCLPLKIEDADSVLAVGNLILHVSTGWLAHIIVTPGQRRRGLGAAITQELIASAEAHGRTTLLLIATAMGAPLYERLGFHRSCDYKFYDAREQIETPLPPLVRRLEPSDVPGICALDRRATGEDRRLLLASGGWRGWVHDGPDRGELRGYYLSDLGEGTIVAQDADAGVALMAVRLATTDECPVVPAGNDAAHALLLRAGFEMQSSAARMVRGGDDLLVPGMVFNRVGGHAG
jgi:GNAT superfamily N-acetyltransferase